MSIPPYRSGHPDRLQLDRRTVLVGLGGMAGVGFFSSETAAVGAAEFSIEQDGRCAPIVPLSGSQPVEAVYDLDQFSSQGTVDLQRPDTTITFLYDGPAGLSLVVVHGGPGGDGGSATWTIAGVPGMAEWVVKDDFYIDPETGEQAASNFDRWDLSGDTHTIDWTWADERTDGGVLAPLGEPFELTIEPAYNEAASLWEEYYSGRVRTWQFLSGDRVDPMRHDLALDRPLTVRSGPCDRVWTVEIDVHPGSDRNPINPRSEGVVPVAIHGSDEVKPSNIDTGSIRFGPPAVIDAGDGATPAHDGHGTDPLIVHFPVGPAGFTADSSRATLVGHTDDGRPFVGSDEVTIVGESGGSSSNDRREEDTNEEESDRNRSKDDRNNENRSKERADDEDKSADRGNGNEKRDKREKSGENREEDQENGGRRSDRDRGEGSREAEDDDDDEEEREDEEEEEEEEDDDDDNEEEDEEEEDVEDEEEDEEDEDDDDDGDEEEEDEDDDEDDDDGDEEEEDEDDDEDDDDDD